MCGALAATTGWELRTIDMQIEELLHSDISCSIALPRLPKRVALEDSKLLKGTRVSVLDEDWDVSCALWRKGMCVVERCLNHAADLDVLWVHAALHMARSSYGTKDERVEC